MTAVGAIIKGRARRVRCDGCGRISSDRDGYYFDRKLKRGGTISSKGRNCEHDFCKQCEAKNTEPYACPKCGARAAPPTPVSTAHGHSCLACAGTKFLGVSLWASPFVDERPCERCKATGIEPVPASPLTVPAEGLTRMDAWCPTCQQGRTMIMSEESIHCQTCGGVFDIPPTAEGEAEVPAGFGESCFCGVTDREHGFGPRCVDWPKRCLCGMGAMAAKLVTAGGLKSYRVECTRERCWSGPERETVREACRAWNALSTTTAPTPVEDGRLKEKDYEEVEVDHRRLVRELDVLLNGEHGAAKQASLCDIVGQLRAEREAEPERMREIRERLERVSTMPWTHDSGDQVARNYDGGIISDYSTLGTDDPDFVDAQADAEFIARAPEDVRCLLTRLSQAEAQLAELRASNGERFGADWANWKAATERVAELTAQVETIRRETWQPISTAPKDGTEILLAHANSLWIDQWTMVNELDGFWMMCDQWEDPETPTHWMPLPSPPEAEGSK